MDGECNDQAEMRRSFACKWEGGLHDLAARPRMGLQLLRAHLALHGGLIGIKMHHAKGFERARRSRGRWLAS